MLNKSFDSCLSATSFCCTLWRQSLVKCCVPQLLPKQDVLKRMLSLKTKRYRQPKAWCDASQPVETDNCAVCLEPFNNNQVRKHTL